MPILPFRREPSQAAHRSDLAGILDGFSIEVMPRTAAKIESFRDILPAGTRVYVAHLDGTPIDDMVATTARLRGEGFAVMPHFPARSIANRAELATWIDRYRSEADVREALVIAGGRTTPRGAFESSMELLETGLFEAAGFDRLHVGGHPEGNRDIDPDGSTAAVDAALLWKQRYSVASSANMAIVTQFAFEAEPVRAWADRLKAMGITLPIHVGVAGPAKLQTMLKFAIACGVGPSIAVLQRRARDVAKLLTPFEPDSVLRGLAAARDATPDNLIRQVHLFPLGGIRATTDYVGEIAAAGKESHGPAR